MASMAKVRSSTPPDVHVHAENKQALGQQLHFLQHTQISFVGCHGLIHPFAERMGGGRHDLHAFAAGQTADKAALLDQRFFELGDIFADRGAQLHHGLVEFRL